MAIDKKLLKRLKALYVEDDENIRNELASLLGNFFDTVYTASDGQEGLELFIKHQDDIDVVLSDINMPKMTGIEMVKKLGQSIPKYLLCLLLHILIMNILLMLLNCESMIILLNLLISDIY